MCESALSFTGVLLMVVKNVKLQEVCCENAEKKVNGNACVYTSKIENLK